MIIEVEEAILRRCGGIITIGTTIGWLFLLRLLAIALELQAAALACELYTRTVKSIEFKNDKYVNVERTPAELGEKQMFLRAIVIRKPEEIANVYTSYNGRRRLALG